MDFKLSSNFKPTGDQPEAIKKLLLGLETGLDTQVLRGVTGSGKTFTLANVIEKYQKPTLVITHNKTLAGQLYQEFRDFFPKNAVSYFVSYYDYYQPEAYIPQSDTYIEKETDINDEIDKLRLAATTNLLTRKDVIVVASVSCIYNLGSPLEYARWLLRLTEGMVIDPKDIMHRLNDLQYERADYDFRRGCYRWRGEILDIYPAYGESVVRLELGNKNIEKLYLIDPMTGTRLDTERDDIDLLVHDSQDGRAIVTIYPAKHYLTDPKSHEDAIREIERDLSDRVKKFEDAGKIVEAHRLNQKVTFDLEMIREMGYVNGIENYSRYFDGRKPGGAPYSLLDYFNLDPFFHAGDHSESPLQGQRDWLCIVDESHMTIPQVRGMFNGDQARKKNLIDYGFRLPSALDNRPLRFDEFERRVSKMICMSATPGDWELGKLNIKRQSEKKRKGEILQSSQTSPLRQVQDRQDFKSAQDDKVMKIGLVEQLIRPTGLLDPEIVVRPVDTQVNDLISEIQLRVEKGERVLVTTLTKRMAEDLSSFIGEKGIKVNYLHSEIETLERLNILDRLRMGEYDVVVGINLLREGLDLPEVSLVAILDADKEGFLRSETSLIQTMGRAARHINGMVIMYADKVTGSMKRAMDEVNRRREIQLEYNEKHGIRPAGIIKPVREKLIDQVQDDEGLSYEVKKGKRSKKKYIDDSELTKLLVMDVDALTPEERKRLIRGLKKFMNKAAKDLNFELAAKLRDKVEEVS